jgi:tetratricopeptide (TPR) repeat protein
MLTRNAANGTCCPDPATLKKLLLDELDPTVVETVEEHVGVCPGCQQVLSRLVGSLPNTLAVHGRAEDDTPPDLPGYTLLGRIDAGGMGVVWHVRDLQFGRDLAVKVMASWGRTSPRLIERFLAEAKICAQLTHPSIVPVHAMSRLADGRPYYTMKLVEGQTLAALLEGGPAPEARRMEFVQIFSQVCQALAFAHGRGVIHRDLKPENVMVGAHGEVQLMDWGLAKMLPGTDASDRPREDSESIVSEPGQAEATRTRAGSILGTAAYMPPEQAQGRVEEVDRQSDVFGLGGILCRILTGEPTYTGASAEVIRLRAAQADLAETQARLHGCGADPELIQLAQSCLAPRKEDRPADAGTVATQLAAYQAGVQDRLRQAELERATAQAAATAERKARRRTRALAVAVLALVALAAGGGLWMQQLAAQRRAEQARQEGALRQEVADALDRAVRFRQAGDFEFSRRLLEQARERLADDGPDELRTRVEQCLADTALARRLDDARQQASFWVKGKLDFEGAEKRYAAALAEAGLMREGEEPGEVGARVRNSAVRAEIVAALDDWAGMTKDNARRAWLMAVARITDPNPDRNRLRRPELWQDPDALLRLALRPATALLSPQLTAALARTLQERNKDALALLRAAQAQQPDDYWLNFVLGDALLRAKQWDESIGYFRAALALRPRSSYVHTSLGVAFAERGQEDEALRHYEEAVRLDPTNAVAQVNLGNTLTRRGQSDAALPHYEEALRIAPHYADAHNDFGLALYGKGQVEKAIDHFKEALHLDPKYADAHYNLGLASYTRGRIEEAIGHYEESIRLDPKNAKAHNNLGLALYEHGQVEAALPHYEEALRLDPNQAMAHLNLGNALDARGKAEEAIGHYQEALRFDPKAVQVHYDLGVTLYRMGRVDEAINHYKETLCIDPKYIKAHNNLGTILYGRGQVDEAIGHFEEVLRLDPGHVTTHYNLANALKGQGRVEEAIGHYEDAIRLDPKYAEAHCNLGNTLLRQGRFEEALPHLQQGHQLGSKRSDWRYPSDRWVQRAQHLLLLDRKLPAILAGQVRPADAQEQLGLAEVCTIKKWDAAAARFFADAFAAQPSLADAHLYDAACVAARAGCGQGEDTAQLSDSEKAGLRQQARKWLDADLALQAKQITRDRRAAEKNLRQWLKDSNLSGVRDPAALAELPQEEQRQWRSLWLKIEQLLGKASK